MGIYDRDYYRREGPSFLGAIAERGKACKWLIGINVVCFVLQAFSEPRVQYQQDEDGNPKAVFVEPVRAENKFTEAFLLDADQVGRIRALVKSLPLEQLEMHEMDGFGRFVVHDEPALRDLHSSMADLVSERVGERVAGDLERVRPPQERRYVLEDDPLHREVGDVADVLFELLDHACAPFGCRVTRGALPSCGS